MIPLARASVVRASNLANVPGGGSALPPEMLSRYAQMFSEP